MGNEEKKVVKVKTVKVKPKEAPAPEPVKVEVPEEPVKQEPVAEKAAVPFYKKWWFWLIVAAAESMLQKTRSSKCTATPKLTRASM